MHTSVEALTTGTYNFNVTGHRTKLRFIDSTISEIILLICSEVIPFGTLKTTIFAVMMKGALLSCLFHVTLLGSTEN